MQQQQKLQQQQQEQYRKVLLKPPQFGTSYQKEDITLNALNATVTQTPKPSKRNFIDNLSPTDVELITKKLNNENNESNDNEDNDEDKINVDQTVENNSSETSVESILVDT